MNSYLKSKRGSKTDPGQKYKTKHEPLIHITKRTSVSKMAHLGYTLIAIAVALVFCGLLVTAISGIDPIKVYVEMFKGTFGGEVTKLKSYHSVAILLAISLAVTPAFKMKFWNIGAEGQVLMGSLAATYVMLKFGPYLYESMLIALMFAAAILAGMIWGLIPAIFKAIWNTNETLYTLMMNYVATTIVGYFIMVTDKSGHNNLGIINERTQFGWLPRLFGKPYILNIIIIAVVTVIVYIYLKYSKQGYEISVVGESRNTAKYVGINVKKVIIRTMAISGAICGLTGILLVAGTPTPSMNPDLVGGQGFTAILVSWMAKFNPLTMVLVSFLIVFMRDGGAAATDALKIDASIGDVLTGIIIFAIIVCEFCISYKINFRGTKKGENK
ncbi:MAG: ABC transporter permease [Ruminococcaceae bacterium]|nr:ABC transporter permease [Oscillospiraceae bacterium]